MEAKPSVVYENEEVVVLNKPAGLIVHPDGYEKGPSVSDWVREQYPETRTVGESFQLRTGEVIERPGIVHRLDRDTSGALLVARTPEAFAHLKRQFQERAVKKVYHAFVYGEMKQKDGRIDRPIGKSAKNFRLRSAQRGARGTLREAVTEYSVQMIMPDVSFVEIRPHTGRTHQIRVHFKAINHPVVCDPLYAPKREALLGFSRLALHAHGLTFRMISGEERTVEAPYPHDFRVAVDRVLGGGSSL